MRRAWIVAAMFVVLATAGSAVALDIRDFNPVSGPATVDLGRDVATITVGEEYIFIDAENTRKLMKALGNPPSNAELGTIIPKSEAEWFIVFEYFETGYVQDDEGKSLNADKLFDSIRRGTEQSNAERKALGHSALHLTRWVEAPHYDELRRRLVWALAAKGDSRETEIVNYNTRLLGRHGLISVVMVTDVESFNRDKAFVPDVIAGVSFKPGKRYEEFVRGQDKLAEYGLAALVAGGAGVAAVKLAQAGFLARFWKAIVVGGMALLGGLWKLLTGGTRKTA
jgi:uncharacterized membrane-anchored protein